MTGEIQNLLSELKTHKETEASLRERYKVIIQDKTLPLEERWKFFMETGYELGEKLGDVCGSDFKCIEKIHPRGSSSFFSKWTDRHRYENINVAELVDELPYDMPYLRKRKEAGEKLSEICELFLLLDVEALQEEILEKNLWSFIMDW